MELSPDNSDDNMAAAVVDDINQQHPQSGPKRYRPAPAKTFQCRGYGECRMVFSRSEHLARHIRKHTGERPFTCHCSKQFSRLDNLRQHAQTVHADKQDQNERMMRDLTSLHASMAAANKLSSTRSGRRPPTIKQEDLGGVPLHQRPGTSTGYEGDHNSFLYQQNSYSFRDSSQSFLGPSTSPAAGAAPGQSFLPFSSPFGFALPDSRDGRPRTSSSRPHTASNRSLPPLSAVVSNALAPSPGEQHQPPPPPPPPPRSIQSFSGQQQPILPGPLNLRRPSTATRPGTAPAFFSAYSGQFGMGFSRPELSLQSYGRSTLPALGPPPPPPPPAADPDPSSPINDASPFFFAPPAIDPSPTSSSSRKRPFPGDDASSTSRESDYGSESRPQSRRLSVMELCNDNNILSRSDSRPTTSSGLVSSASALALVDRPSPPLTAPISTRLGSTGTSGQQEEFGRLSTIRRNIPQSPAASLLSTRFATTPTFSYSPTFSTAASTASYSPRSTRGGSISPYSPRSPLHSTLGHDGSTSSSSTAASTNAVSRRSHGGDDESSSSSSSQIRFTASSHASAALGLRV